MRTRRDMLAFTAGAVAAKTVLPMAAEAKPAQFGQVSPDPALLTALGQFDAYERQFNSLYRGGSNYMEDEDERDAVVDQIRMVQDPVLERVCSLRATTLDGILARARTIVLQDAELDPEADAMTEEYTNSRLMAALLRDLLAMGRAA